MARHGKKYRDRALSRKASIAEESPPPPPYSEQAPVETDTPKPTAHNSTSGHQYPRRDKKPKKPVVQHEDLDETTPLLATPHYESFSQTVVVFRRDDRRFNFPAATCIFSLCTLILISAGLFIIAKFVGLGFSTPPVEPLPTYSVAIIGAGPAGISAAKHLREMESGNQFRLNITIFESSSAVGGRLVLTDSANARVFPYDDRGQDPIAAEYITGSSLVWGNPLFKGQYEKCAEDRVEIDELPTQKAGYFNGERLVSESYRPYKETPWSSWLGLLWHYGRSVSSIQNIVDGSKFRQKFEILPGALSIHDMLAKLDSIESARTSSSKSLDEQGISSLYREEVVGPQVRRVFAQDLDKISGLALSMALSKEDRDGKYSGGDLIDMLDQILYRSKVHVKLDSEVTGIKRLPTESETISWLVQYNEAMSKSPQYGTFDHVIMAAPGSERRILPAVSSDPSILDLQTYRPIHVTFFTSSTRLDPASFGSAGPLPEQLLFIYSPKLGLFQGVHEISYVRDLARVRDGDQVVEYMYRCLSDHNIMDHLIPSLAFEGENESDGDNKITWSYQTRIDHAYPLVFPRTQFPSFKLPDENVWSTSAVDAIGSTVDLSWAAGQIVAKQVIDALKG